MRVPAAWPILLAASWPAASMQPGGGLRLPQLFTWTHEPNEPGTVGPGTPERMRWVQYTLPVAEDIARIDLFRVDPPDRWRLLDQENREWPSGASDPSPRSFPRRTCR
jgi:hypothetical protein